MAELLRVKMILRDFIEPGAPDAATLKMAPRLQYLSRVPYFLFMRWQKENQ